MLNDNGIAWMIAGGVRDESRDDQRQILHRIAFAESRPSKANVLRTRIAAIVGRRADALDGHATMSTDCCPA